MPGAAKPGPCNSRCNSSPAGVAATCIGLLGTRNRRGELQSGAMNQLYYGDNLDVLRRHVDDESVDLVYLDPPFNSNASYNVLFAEHDGTQAAAQIKAFEDTWQWDEDAARAYEEVVEAGGRVSAGDAGVPDVPRRQRHAGLPRDDGAAAGRTAPRAEAHRQLYLHCDPTASHYLKMLMDAVFGPATFGTRSSGSGRQRTAGPKYWPAFTT